MSAGDFERDLEERLDAVARRGIAKVGLFEKSQYFRRLFPSLKIQKPGYDLYGTTTTVLFLLALYTGLYYGNFSVDQANYLVGSKNNISIFKGDMVICLITITTIIVIERYVNRSDTKPVQQQGFHEDRAAQDFFSDNEMFKRTSTSRSMTVKLKTMKTSDLDVQDSSAQNFLKSMYGDDADQSRGIDATITKITKQQKCKYMMHLVILVVVHIFVFWFIPITGNYKLYGAATCDEKQSQYYGCKNFHRNPFLIGFYTLLCLYLLLSALQIRYGFPIHKKPSSVLQYEDSDLAVIGAQVFSALPFLVELRALLDFTFARTALDIFQFWQLWQFHYDFYNAKASNKFYRTKVLGAPTEPLDKCLFGWLISCVILGLLVGPLLFFSDAGGFVAPNPVHSGSVQLDFLIDKRLSVNELTSLSETPESIALQQLTLNGEEIGAGQLELVQQ